MAMTSHLHTNCKTEDKIISDSFATAVFYCYRNIGTVRNG